MRAEDTSLGAQDRGILGTIGDVLSAPRRMLWGALGGPEHGNQLMSQLFGMDENSGVAKGLGFGAEMLLDPLNMILAAPLLKGAMGASRAGAGAMEALNAAKAAEAAGAAGAAGAASRIGGGGATAAREALLLQEQGNVARQLAKEATMAQDLGRADLLGMSMGQTKAFQQATPETIAAFEAAGLGRGTPGTMRTLAPGYEVGGLEVMGGRLPQGATMAPVSYPTGGLTKAGNPAMRSSGSAVAIGPEGLPQMPAGAADQLLMSPMGSSGDELAAMLAQRTRPAGMRGQAEIGQDITGNILRQGQMRRVAGVTDRLRQQAIMGDVAARQAAVDAMGMGGFDWGMVGTGLGGGSALGAALGMGAF